MTAVSPGSAWIPRDWARRSNCPDPERPRHCPHGIEEGMGCCRIARRSDPYSVAEAERSPAPQACRLHPGETKPCRTCWDERIKGLAELEAEEINAPAMCPWHPCETKPCAICKAETDQSLDEASGF